MAQDNIRGYFYMITGLILFIVGTGTWIFRIALTFLGLYLMNYGLIVNGHPPLLYNIARLIKIILERD